MRLAHLNLLCLAGASLGALSLFLTWTDSVVSPIAYCTWPDSGVIDILFNWCDAECALRVACTLFLIGVVLTFLTTLGAFIEMAGLGGFFIWYANREEQRVTGELLPESIGPYVGIASALLVLLALAKPMGIGYNGASVGMRQRLLSVGLSWSEAAP
jgi:hypothetical protein